MVMRLFYPASVQGNGLDVALEGTSIGLFEIVILVWYTVFRGTFQLSVIRSYLVCFWLKEDIVLNTEGSLDEVCHREEHCSGSTPRAKIREETFGAQEARAFS